MDNQRTLEAITKRLARLDERRAQLLAERDQAIRAAVQDSMTLRRVAELTGLSFQRVDQIVRDT